MGKVKAAFAWVGRTIVYATKSMKAHVAVVLSLLTWATVNLAAPWDNYARVALVVLTALGVTAARRAYGAQDAPVDAAAPKGDE